MMDINTAANVAEIAGGIAILASLTYAGFQIRQSNRIAKVESIRSSQSNSFLVEYDLATIGRGFTSFESLNYEAKWEFHGYFMRFWSHYVMVIQTRDLGLLDDATVDVWSKAIAQTLATPGGQEYWKGGACDTYEPLFVKVLDDYVRNNSESIVPYNEHMNWMTEPG
jgi:hypothetical protein